MTTIEAHALAVSVEERIAELWKVRQWYRVNRWADWPDLRKESEVELRALVKLARKARKASSAIVDAMDPMTLAKGEYPEGVSYHDHQAAYR